MSRYLILALIHLSDIKCERPSTRLNAANTFILSGSRLLKSQSSIEVIGIGFRMISISLPWQQVKQTSTSPKENQRYGQYRHVPTINEQQPTPPTHNLHTKCRVKKSALRSFFLGCLLFSSCPPVRMKKPKWGTQYYVHMQAKGWVPAILFK